MESSSLHLLIRVSLLFSGYLELVIMVEIPLTGGDKIASSGYLVFYLSLLWFAKAFRTLHKLGELRTPYYSDDHDRPRYLQSYACCKYLKNSLL